ncbi:MAG: hypothetical protein KKI08_23825 [Armatimonadetes bacterium]|nr:hypothetical protein [Armatimonadota bacterium]
MAEEKSISELMKEFVEQLMLYVRERGKESVSTILLQPLQKVGIKAALLVAATAMVVLGAVFLGIFAVLGFAELFGGDLLWGYLCGGLLVIIVAATLVLAMSRVGKEVRKDDRAKDGVKGGGDSSGSSG